MVTGGPGMMWNGQKHTGPGTITEKALWKVLCLLGGSIIRTVGRLSYRYEFSDPLTLHVYPGSDASLRFMKMTERPMITNRRRCSNQDCHHDKKKNWNFTGSRQLSGLPAERSFESFSITIVRRNRINGMELDAGALL